jgi:hypothetical protein
VQTAAHTFSGNTCTVCGYTKSSGGSGGGGGGGSSSSKADIDITVSPKSGSTVAYGDRIKITAESDEGIEYVVVLDESLGSVRVIVTVSFCEVTASLTFATVSILFFSIISACSKK